MYKAYNFMSLTSMEEFIGMSLTTKQYAQHLNKKDFMDKHKPYLLMTALLLYKTQSLSSILLYQEI